MEEYFKLHKYAFEQGYIRTISNIRIQMDDYIEMMKKINNEMKNDIMNNNNYEEYINLFDDLELRNILKKDIKEIKFCNISTNIDKTYSLVNPECIINIPLKEKKNKNLKINIIKTPNNLENILNYLSFTDNSISKNNYRKNNRKKLSLCTWKSQFINIKDHNFKRKPVKKNNAPFVLEDVTIDNITVSRKLINIIEINDNQLITGGRTLLPRTLFFTFKNKNIISFKDKWIQIIPSKFKTDQENEKYESFSQNINNLFYFVNKIFLEYTKKLNISNSFVDSIKDFMEAEHEQPERKKCFLFKNISFNSDFTYNLNKTIILLPIKFTDDFINILKENNIFENINIKNQTNCITNRNIKSFNQFLITDKFIKENIKKYENFTETIENTLYKDIIYMKNEKIIDLYKDIYNLNPLFD